MICNAQNYCQIQIHFSFFSLFLFLFFFFFNSVFCSFNGCRKKNNGINISLCTLFPSVQNINRAAKTKEVEIKKLIISTFLVSANRNNKLVVKKKKKKTDMELIYREITLFTSFDTFKYVSQFYTWLVVKSCHENCIDEDTKMNSFICFILPLWCDIILIFQINSDK